MDIARIERRIGVRATPDQIWDLIADLGMDMAKARSDADSPAVAQLLAQDIADMKAINLQGTPTFFINGVRYAGGYPAAPMERLFRSILEQQNAE